MGSNRLTGWQQSMLQNADWSMHFAEASLPSIEFIEGGVKIRNIEVGPHTICKQEFGIGGLPQQKVREALLTTGSDQQIHFPALPRESWASSG
jgi:hypothetical protein